MAFDTSPFSTSVTITGEPTINVEKPGLFGLATAAPLRTGFTTPLIPGSTAQAPTGDSPVIQALKKRNVIDDGGDSGYDSWTPPPAGVYSPTSTRTRGLSGLIEEEVVKPVKTFTDAPVTAVTDLIDRQIVQPVKDVYKGFTTNPIGYVTKTVTEKPFSTLGLIISNIMKVVKVGGFPYTLLPSVFGSMLDSLTGPGAEYMQGIQHGLFSPTAPAQGVGAPGDRSMMGVYDINQDTGRLEFIGTELEVGQRRAAELAQFTDPYSEAELHRGTPPGEEYSKMFANQYQDYGYATTAAGRAEATQRANQRANEFAWSSDPSMNFYSGRTASYGKNLSETYRPSPSEIQRADEMAQPYFAPSSAATRAAQIKSGFLEDTGVDDPIWTDTGAQTGGFQDPGDSYDSGVSYSDSGSYSADTEYGAGG